MECDVPRHEGGISTEKKIPLQDEMTMVPDYFQIVPQRSKKGKRAERLARVGLTGPRLGPSGQEHIIGRFS